ncbi:MAG: General secretion pathway protein G [Candidatus Collierbacteria bacterium GW2011_GWB1_44_6]|uniref:General secretion pathway protein G n=2 Tax=Candidatus Collieribacteriota TaxID=1752725 RepID=A0A0G1LX00_9BACT|nr:MAG: General secretion pathway protein G [Candidatus Collierbacteria bacterium GW2011_GWC2_43_12]KKT73352.1 MAG: General secretion pathway protein G [Candidatus Collierbacteria bacterium GW2011_GWB1_44_6]
MKNGFTLIELMVAIGIMAVLTGMAVFNFNQSRLRARDVQRKNDIKQLQNALELYKNDTNSYPQGTGFQDSLMSPVSYIRAIFGDPRGSEWVDYQYIPAADLKTYYLQACLENSADSSKTTNVALCDLFTADTSNQCRCGKDLSNKTGVMYIVSQP